MSWVSNKCGGSRFRTLPDHRIEIEDIGTPRIAPGTTQYKNLVKTWKNWGARIRWFAFINGIPPSYLLAIAAQETGFLSGEKKEQAHAVSPAGAEGIMQVMPCRIFNDPGYRRRICGKRMTNPWTSLRAGAYILKRLLKTYHGEFPFAATAYNSGAVSCHKGLHPVNIFQWHHEQDYVYHAIRYNNTAVAMGVNKSAWPWVLGVVALTTVSVDAISRRSKYLP